MGMHYSSRYIYYLESLILKLFFHLFSVLKDYGLYDFINKSWKINYVSIEKSIQPLDENLVSLININGPIDIVKLFK